MNDYRMRLIREWTKWFPIRLHENVENDKEKPYGQSELLKLFFYVVKFRDTRVVAAACVKYCFIIYLRTKHHTTHHLYSRSGRGRGKQKKKNTYNFSRV